MASSPSSAARALRRALLLALDDGGLDASVEHLVRRVAAGDVDAVALRHAADSPALRDAVDGARDAMLVQLQRQRPRHARHHDVDERQGREGRDEEQQRGGGRASASTAADLAHEVAAGATHQARVRAAARAADAGACCSRWPHAPSLRGRPRRPRTLLCRRLTPHNDDDHDDRRRRHSGRGGPRRAHER